MVFQQNYNQRKWSYGYSLVELLLAIALFGVLVTTLFTGFISTREGRPQQQQRLQATALMQEAIEAMRIVREESWDLIATNGTYYPSPTATSWALSAGVETIDALIGLTRQIEISDVYRDGSGAITDTGGTLDPSTKAVTISVSWNEPLITTESVTLYFSRYLDNFAFTHTTDVDFSATGSVADLVVYTVSDDGEVILDAAGPGRGNWCDPGTSAVSTLDLPRQGAARAVTAIEGKVFSGTGENASGVSLAYVTVTDTIPPVTTLAGTFDGYKTNDVFGTDTYGFLATDTNNKEVVIVNLSDPMTQAGYYDISGPQNAESIFVLGNVGYVTANGTLYAFDMSSVVGTASQSTLGTVGLAGTAKSVYVVGDYAYIAIDSTSNQLQVVDVSNPSSMSVVGNLTVNGANGRDVYVSPDNSRAYLVVSADPTNAEFFIINTEDPANPTQISSYDTNGMDPKAVDMVLSGNRAVVVGTGAEEYQVVTIVPETNPVRCGGFNEDTGIYDISTVVEADTDAYAYVTTGQSDAELKVIEGGPGGSYSTSGTYESPPMDLGYTAAFNRLSFSASIPTDTTLEFQIAGAPQNAGSCDTASYTFVGPDGTDATFFDTSPSAVPFDSTPGGYDNPAQCVKYRAYFGTTNILSTPELQDVTINYSP